MWLEMMGEQDDGGETEEKSQRDCIYTCHFAPVPKSRGDVIVRFRTGYIATRMLRHGRDVHPTWVEGRVSCVILTSMEIRFERLRSEEDLR